ncbi:MAG: response regulator [Planctomycetes bacterium]|nr:response regulator [Planctomycetota bacterium]MBU1517716.1 response regulator [Planctomycetota bacterium]MBU2458272.1 response regulator [Planctomycetota bacterium]MBU2596240.1 response regulator [Planctomycetota bacterium]
MDTAKELFTTGEAAELCSLSQQTIIRCFDSGRLRGFRIPGSKFRKIPRDSLLKFMRDNNIPMINMQSGKKRLLIVDDDAEIVELMSDVLIRDGRFEIRTASTGYDAGIITQKFRPDLILLDYMLPDVNGNIVCKTIKQDPEFSSTRIIIISGVINQTEIDDLLKAGAEEFVKKPFSVTELIDRIAVVLEL